MSQENYRYEPDEVVYDEDSEEYNRTSNQILSLDALDGVCWIIASNFATVTPPEEMAEKEHSWFEGTEAEEDLEELITYNKSAAIHITEIAQQFFMEGIDVLARAQRFERDHYDDPENGIVHSELDRDIDKANTEWVSTTPAEAFIDDESEV